MPFGFQSKVSQAGATVFHLLRGYTRVRWSSHTGRKRTIERRLRQGVTPTGKEAGDHEQTGHKKQE